MPTYSTNVPYVGHICAISRHFDSICFLKNEYHDDNRCLIALYLSMGQIFKLSWCSELEYVYIIIFI